jgi:hypothetical protein
MTPHAWILACLVCLAIGYTWGRPQPAICIEGPGYILSEGLDRRIT